MSTETQTKIDDGGQAFPGPVVDAADPRRGLSIRDYFAAKALQGFCANPAVFASNGMSGWALVNTDERNLTGYAYVIADEMIAARKAEGRQL